MATKSKTQTLTLTGTLTRCDLKREHQLDWNHTQRYAPNTERYAIFLDCAMQTEEGDTVYFKTPESGERVSLGGPCAIVTFTDSEYDQEKQAYIFPADHPWFRKEGTISVATAGRSSDVHLVPKVKVGDRVSIRGRVKAERTSKAGNPYRVLNYIKKV